MQLALLRLAAAIVVLFVCGFGIRHLPNESGLAMAAWFGFIFLGIPLLLLAIRDSVLAVVKRSDESFRGWLMVHVCAVFAGIVGLLLAWGARASEHPKADLHQWLPLILVGLVYIAPILLAINSGSLDFLRLLVAPFRRDKDRKDE